jgi:hypothetical protein
MKTFKQWEKNKDLQITQFLSPLNEIDWYLYEHILCGYVAPSYDNGKIGQSGEPENKINGVYTYMTVATINDKYYYLGILPAFQQE